MPRRALIPILALISAACGPTIPRPRGPAQTQPAASSAAPAPTQEDKKDRLFLMGLGMLRLNWANVEGDEIRYQYSDLGLPADFSTRERASFMLDGTFGHGAYSLSGHLSYDPENRITEPPLEFLLTVGNEHRYASVGDYRSGVFLDSVFARYYHPFRGAIVGARTDRVGAELVGGMSRGESGTDLLPATFGAGPYYLADAPILRGSEIVYIVVRSAMTPDLELKRVPMIRNIDFFIDYDRGSLLFTSSLYPTDDLGNPVFILATYQFESLSGRFTRDVLGLRAFVAPVPAVKLSFSSIADADAELPLGEALSERRGIYTVGLNVDSERLTFFGEGSFSEEPSVSSQQAFFGGGTLKLSRRIRVYLNSWTVDTDFPTFANEQLEYGYSLYQIFPAYADRTIYLSPFQFTRNLGADLYPFILARTSIDESEVNGFAEWEGDTTRVSVGHGWRRETTSGNEGTLSYLSLYRDSDKRKAWGKVELDRLEGDAPLDARGTDVLVGIRERLWKGQHGDLFVQADYENETVDDQLDLVHDTRQQTASFFAEYLTGRDGVFAGYRKERLADIDADETVTDIDVAEVGVRNRVYKGLFVDTRFRTESASRRGEETTNRILSLGGGIESRSFRAMGRYEIQTNSSDTDEGRRRLWSLYLFGTPTRSLNLNLNYYRQTGRDEAPTSLSERSEEQLALRALWHPLRWASFYSQWRYDRDAELYPPIDTVRSNSLATVQGIKLRFAEKWESLVNYKLLRITGPIQNQKSTAAAELARQLFRHYRLGAGAEYIEFTDDQAPEGNYKTTVGYFKLVAVF